MTIQPSIPQSLSALKNAKYFAAPVAAGEVAVQTSLPSDAAEINFDAPAPSKTESLYAAAASDAAKLEGTLGEYQPGELIIRTKPGFSLSGEEGSVVADYGASVLTTFDTPGGLSKSDGGEFLHIKLPAGVSVEQAVAAMAKDDRVEFAVPNHTYGLPDDAKGTELAAGETPQAPVDDADYAKLWGMNNEGQTGGKVDADIDAPEAWQLHTGRSQAEGAHITAVIDTGVDYNHPDLKDNIWVNPGEIAGDGIDNDGNGVIDDVHGYNAYSDNGDPLDGYGHGSHCTGTIAGVGNNKLGVVGVNQHANIMAVKIFNDQGSTNAAAIIRGIQYATKMGARITSNSWGGGAANEGIKQAFADSPALHIIAAGNNGRDNDKFPAYPANYDLPNIVAVAATDHKDGLASFSEYGKTTVDLGAPGVDILSTVPGGYDVYSGTSMATPHVAGAATLIASYVPDISNENLKAALLGGVDKIASLDGKTVTGGRLNAHKSLELAKSLDFIDKADIG
jgi:subtilisin family serine protease